MPFDIIAQTIQPGSADGDGRRLFPCGSLECARGCPLNEFHAGFCHGEPYNPTQPYAEPAVKRQTQTFGKCDCACDLYACPGVGYIAHNTVDNCGCAENDLRGL